MIEQATSEHIRYVCDNIREDDMDELLLTSWVNDVGDLVDSLYCAAGSKIAVLHDGVPVCIFGVVPLFPGVGQAWLVGTDFIGSSGVEVAHACKTTIKTLKSGHMHRIQAYSAGFYTRAHRWLEMIGFRKESTLHKYGRDASDFYCYVA